MTGGSSVLSFRVHDDDVSLTIDPDDSSQLRVAFSSLDKCKAFFQSEVVPDEDANTFTWYIGHVQLSFSFTGTIVPVSLIIAPEDGAGARPALPVLPAAFCHQGLSRLALAGTPPAGVHTQV